MGGAPAGVALVANQRAAMAARKLREKEEALLKANPKLAALKERQVWRSAPHTAKSTGRDSRRTVSLSRGVCALISFRWRPLGARQKSMRDKKVTGSTKRLGVDAKTDRAVVSKTDRKRTKTARGGADGDDKKEEATGEAAASAADDTAGEKKEVGRAHRCGRE